METTLYSMQHKRKRKFLLFLPLMVLPFTTLLFWALGGGNPGAAQVGEAAAGGGLNLQLPDAHLKEDSSLTKLSYYEKATADSLKMDAQLKNDPFYLRYRERERAGWSLTGDSLHISPSYKPFGVSGRTGLNTSAFTGINEADRSEARIYQKLQELNTTLSQATGEQERTKRYSEADHRYTPSKNSADIDRLERIMHRSGSDDNSEDPELKQLNAMLEKIMDIQHPERVKEKNEQQAEQTTENTYAVQASGDENHTSLISNNIPLGQNIQKNNYTTNGFFSLVDEKEDTLEMPNTVQAVIHETQTVVEGAIVKLRLVSDITINSALIPGGSFLFGIASLQGERLNIKINSIRYKNDLFPVQLSVVDLDGLDGVYVPGTITGDVMGNSADRAVQGIGITTLNPSLGAQAAGAGIEAAKSLLSRKVKLIKVTLQAGYQVLLRDERSKPAS